MKILLWLDDVRNPFDDKIDWLSYSPIGKNVQVEWAVSIQDFIDWIIVNGLPDAVCFDHDIADDELTGYDAAKWMVRYHQNNGGKFPKFASQSANPVGKKNIITYLNNYLKHLKSC